MEHPNKLLKLALKQLGANISEKGAQRIAKSLQAVEDVLVNEHRDCNLKSKSGYNSSKCLDETVNTITKIFMMKACLMSNRGESIPLLRSSA